MKCINIKRHNFSGYILNDVPMICKLMQQVVVDFNYLSTPVLENYFEVAMG
jgi:hypothetical protein